MLKELRNSLVSPAEFPNLMKEPKTGRDSKSGYNWPQQATFIDKLRFTRFYSMTSRKCQPETFLVSSPSWPFSLWLGYQQPLILSYPMRQQRSSIL
jgi:hypothetical protein